MKKQTVYKIRATVYLLATAAFAYIARSSLTDGAMISKLIYFGIIAAFVATAIINFAISGKKDD